MDRKQQSWSDVVSESESESESGSEPEHDDEYDSDGSFDPSSESESDSEYADSTALQATSATRKRKREVVQQAEYDAEEPRRVETRTEHRSSTLSFMCPRALYVWSEIARNVSKIEHQIASVSKSETRIVEMSRAYDVQIRTNQNTGNHVSNDGDKRLANVLRTLDSFHKKPTPGQRAFLNSYVDAVLPLIFGSHWDGSMMRVMRERRIKEVRSEVLVIASRQIGKTNAIAMFCAAMLLCVPGIHIGVYSTGNRASGNVSKIVLEMLNAIPGAHRRIIKNSLEYIYVSEHPLAAGIGMQSHEARMLENDPSTSQMMSYPDNATGIHPIRYSLLASTMSSSPDIVELTDEEDDEQSVATHETELVAPSSFIHDVEIEGLPRPMELHDAIKRINKNLPDTETPPQWFVNWDLQALYVDLKTRMMKYLESKEATLTKLGKIVHKFNTEQPIAQGWTAMKRANAITTKVMQISAGDPFDASIFIPKADSDANENGGDSDSDSDDDLAEFVPIENEEAEADAPEEDADDSEPDSSDQEESSSETDDEQDDEDAVVLEETQDGDESQEYIPPVTDRQRVAADEAAAERLDIVDASRVDDEEEQQIREKEEVEQYEEFHRRNHILANTLNRAVKLKNLAAVLRRHVNRQYPIVAAVANDGDEDADANADAQLQRQQQLRQIEEQRAEALKVLKKYVKQVAQKRVNYFRYERLADRIKSIIIRAERHLAWEDDDDDTSPEDLVSDIESLASLGEEGAKFAAELHQKYLVDLTEDRLKLKADYNGELNAMYTDMRAVMISRNAAEYVKCFGRYMNFCIQEWAKTQQKQISSTERRLRRQTVAMVCLMWDLEGRPDQQISAHGYYYIAPKLLKLLFDASLKEVPEAKHIDPHHGIVIEADWILSAPIPSREKVAILEAVCRQIDVGDSADSKTLIDTYSGLSGSVNARAFFDDRPRSYFNPARKDGLDRNPLFSGEARKHVWSQIPLRRRMRLYGPVATHHSFTPSFVWGMCGYAKATWKPVVYEEGELTLRSIHAVAVKTELADTYTATSTVFAFQPVHDFYQANEEQATLANNQLRARLAINDWSGQRALQESNLAADLDPDYDFKEDAKQADNGDDDADESSSSSDVVNTEHRLAVFRLRMLTLVSKHANRAMRAQTKKLVAEAVGDAKKAITRYRIVVDNPDEEVEYTEEEAERVWIQPTDVLLNLPEGCAAEPFEAAFGNLARLCLGAEISSDKFEVTTVHTTFQSNRLVLADDAQDAKQKPWSDVQYDDMTYHMRRFTRDVKTNALVHSLIHRGEVLQASVHSGLSACNPNEANPDIKNSRISSADMIVVPVVMHAPDLETEYDNEMAEIQRELDAQAEAQPRAKSQSQSQRRSLPPTQPRSQSQGDVSDFDTDSDSDSGYGAAGLAPHTDDKEEDAGPMTEQDAEDERALVRSKYIQLLCTRFVSDLERCAATTRAIVRNLSINHWHAHHLHRYNHVTTRLQKVQALVAQVDESRMYFRQFYAPAADQRRNAADAATGTRAAACVEVVNKYVELASRCINEIDDNASLMRNEQLLALAERILRRMDRYCRHMPRQQPRSLDQFTAEVESLVVAQNPPPPHMTVGELEKYIADAKPVTPTVIFALTGSLFAHDTLETASLPNEFAQLTCFAARYFADALLLRIQVFADIRSALKRLNASVQAVPWLPRPDPKQVLHTPNRKPISFTPPPSFLGLYSASVYVTEQQTELMLATTSPSLGVSFVDWHVARRASKRRLPRFLCRRSEVYDPLDPDSVTAVMYFTKLCPGRARKVSAPEEGEQLLTLNHVVASIAKGWRNPIVVDSTPTKTYIAYPFVTASTVSKAKTIINRDTVVDKVRQDYAEVEEDEDAPSEDEDVDDEYALEMKRGRVDPELMSTTLDCFLCHSHYHDVDAKWWFSDAPGPVPRAVQNTIVTRRAEVAQHTELDQYMEMVAKARAALEQRIREQSVSDWKGRTVEAAAHYTALRQWHAQHGVYPMEFVKRKFRNLSVYAQSLLQHRLLTLGESGVSDDVPRAMVYKGSKLYTDFMMSVTSIATLTPGLQQAWEDGAKTLRVLARELAEREDVQIAVLNYDLINTLERADIMYNMLYNLIFIDQHIENMRVWVDPPHNIDPDTLYTAVKRDMDAESWTNDALHPWVGCAYAFVDATIHSIRGNPRPDLEQTRVSFFKQCEAAYESECEDLYHIVKLYSKFSATAKSRIDLVLGRLAEAEEKVAADEAVGRIDLDAIELLDDEDSEAEKDEDDDDDDDDDDGSEYDIEDEDDDSEDEEEYEQDEDVDEEEENDEDEVFDEFHDAEY